MKNQDLVDIPMKIKLPEPKVFGRSRIEELIEERRSVRRYTDRELSNPSFPVFYGRFRESVPRTA